MGKSLILTRVLALIGLATVAGGVHSLVVPVQLSLEDEGFVIPDGSSPMGKPEDAETVSPIEHGASGNAEKGVDAPRTDPGAESAGSGKIDIDLAASLHDRFLAGEPVLFLDARQADAFDAGHIMGALNMPHTRLSSGDGLDEMSMYATPGDGTLLVVYCTGGDCEASEDSAILLKAAGYTNIAVMADGYDDWAESGHPVEGAGVSP